MANWQQEERGSTGTSRALSAPLSRRGMGEALEGGCGLASSAGLTMPGVPPALTPSAGFAERRVFGFHLFTGRGAGAKMLREGASLPAAQPGTAQHGTGAAGSTRLQRAPGHRATRSGSHWPCDQGHRHCLTSCPLGHGCATPSGRRGGKFKLWCTSSSAKLFWHVEAAGSTGVPGR